MKSVSVLCILGLLVLSKEELLERFAWKSLDFAFPNEEVRQMAINEGFYIPEDNFPIGIEVWQNKLFITVPRGFGVPSTLNYIPLDAPYSISPKLIPYPDWATNKAGDCNGLTTTYRVRVDECDRLWVLDSGTVGRENLTRRLCPIALHAFDLKSDRHIVRYQFKPEDVKENTFIANIAIEVGKTCDHTHVYASDELGYRLIVYSLLENDSWIFEHGFFYPDPLKGDFNINGINFQWEDEGVFGMAVSPKSYGERILFFHSLAGHREFMVSTNVLKQKPKKPRDAYHMFIPLGERIGHSSAKTMTEDGLMVFNLIDYNAVGCWDWSKPYNAKNHAIILKDDVGLQYPCDVRISGGNIWVFSNRLHAFLHAKLDFNDVNFRVYTIPLEEAIAGTVCEKKVNFFYHNLVPSFK